MIVVRSDNDIFFLQSMIKEFNDAIGKANNERGRRALIRCDGRHGTIAVRVEILSKL
jgi:hypothetical protein